MAHLSSTTKAYIAGFLDGDGCIMFQLVRRKDYRLGYEVRASIVFYQKAKYIAHLHWLKQKFGDIGYIRHRSDDMAEYTITGLSSVEMVLKDLQLYIKLKREHVEVGRRICNLLKDKTNVRRFINAVRLVDIFGELNYSKRRTNTSPQVIDYLQQHKLYPRNDLSRKR